MNWDWIPLLDFSLCLSEIIKKLHSANELIEIFEFTESTETIKFRRKENEIEITSSFSLTVIDVGFEEFEKEVARLRNNIIADLKDSVGDIDVLNAIFKYL